MSRNKESRLLLFIEPFAPLTRASALRLRAANGGAAKLTHFKQFYRRVVAPFSLKIVNNYLPLVPQPPCSLSVSCGTL